MRWSAAYQSQTLTGGGLLYTVAFLGWFASLARGAMPRGLQADWSALQATRDPPAMRDLADPDPPTFS